MAVAPRFVNRKIRKSIEIPTHPNNFNRDTFSGHYSMVVQFDVDLFPSGFVGKLS